MYEFKLVPAPETGAKGQGRGRRAASAAEDPLTALTTLINLRAAAGWDYAGSEIVPVIRRRFLRRPVTEMCTYLVFRRPLEPRRTAAPAHEAALEAAAAGRAAAEEAERRAAREALVARVRAGARRIVVRPPGPLLLTGPANGAIAAE